MPSGPESTGVPAQNPHSSECGRAGTRRRTRHVRIQGYLITVDDTKKLRLRGESPLNEVSTARVQVQVQLKMAWAVLK